MTYGEMKTLLLDQGFTLAGNEYRKDILVFRRNDAKKRFEVFYGGEHGTEKTPVYYYDKLYKDLSRRAMAYYLTGMYNAIQTFDEA